MGDSVSNMPPRDDGSLSINNTWEKIDELTLDHIDMDRVGLFGSVFDTMLR